MTRGRVALGAGIAGVLVAAAVLWPRSEPVHEPAPPPPPPVLPLPPVPEVAPAPVATPRPLEELAGPSGVVCRVEPAVDGGAARLQLDGDPGEWLAAAAISGHVLVLSSIPEDGSGVLRVEGFAPAAVRWEGARDGQARCDPVTLVAAEAGVTGVVRGARGVTVTACGQPAVLDTDGGFYASAAPGEACVVEARRHLGVWEWSERLEVVPRVGADAVVEIEAPGFEAVLPVVVEDGRVAEVWDDEVDLPAGARIVAVDGEGVPPDLAGFHLATGGEAGSEALVEVEEGGQRFEVTLERRALTFEDWLVR